MTKADNIDRLGANTTLQPSSQPGRNLAPNTKRTMGSKKFILVENTEAKSFCRMSESHENCFQRTTNTILIQFMFVCGLIPSGTALGMMRIEFT